MHHRSRAQRSSVGVWIVACILLVTSAARGDVLVVDPLGAAAGADAVDIQQAVDLAADGDVILVRPGGYGRVVIQGKGLTILGDVSGSGVSVFGSLPAGTLGTTVEVRDLTLGQTVVLRDLRLVGGKPESLLVQDCAGIVHVEACLVLGVAGFPSTQSFGDLNGADGMRVVNARVRASRCLVSGGDGTDPMGFSPSGHGGRGLLLRDGGEVQLEASEVRGGDGGKGSGMFSHAANGGHAVWIAEGTSFGTRIGFGGCDVRGGDGGEGSADAFVTGDGGDGGHGVRATDQALIRRRETSIQGGAAGPGDAPTGFPGAPGLPLQLQATVAMEVFAADWRGLETGGAVREGESLEVRLTGQPGDLPFLWVGPHGSWIEFPQFQGVLGVAFQVLGGTPHALPVLGPAGELVLEFPVPDLGAGVQALPVFMATHTASVADGLLVGPTTVSVLLDAGL